MDQKNRNPSTLGMYTGNQRITIRKNNDQKTQEKKWKSINQ